MLAIDDRDGTVYVETFRIPSACVCELIDKGSTTRIRRPQNILTGSNSHFVYHLTTIISLTLWDPPPLLNADVLCDLSQGSLSTVNATQLQCIRE